MAAGGFQNIILPREFPTQGEVLDKMIGRNQQESQFERSLAERREERDYTRNQQNRLYNLKEIDSDTDYTKFKTGQQAIDDYTIGQLKSIKDKALSQYINLDPAEMEYRLTQDMNDLVGWHTAIKDDYTKMQQGLQQFAKDNPNIDINKANDLAMNGLGKKYMAQGQSGFERLPAEKINHSSNPLDVLNNPSVLGELTNDVKPFQDYVQGMKLTAFEDSEYKSNKGYVKAYKTSGGTSPVAERTYDEQGKPTGVRVKSEDIDFGDGTKLKMLPEDEYKTMMNIPSVRNAALKMWNDEKRSKGMSNIDAPTEERLFRNFLHTKYQKYDISNFKTLDNKDIIPRPQVTVNVGDYSNVNNVYKSVSDQVDKDNAAGNAATRINALNTDAQNIIMEFARKTTNDPEIKYDNIFIHKNENGDMGIYKTTKDENDLSVNKTIPDIQHLIGYMSRTGTNLLAKQPGASEKRTIIKQGEQTQPHTETLAEKMRRLKGQ